MKTTSRSLLLAALASALACGGDGDDAEPPPGRAGLRTCVVSDRLGPPEQVLHVATLPETSLVEGGWRVQISGQATGAPFPSPSPCGFTPARVIALEDPGGTGWWVGLSVARGSEGSAEFEDVTPAIAAPAGGVTLTLHIADTWAREVGIAVSDAGGLLLAVNRGRLLLPPADSGGLSAALGPVLPTVYEGLCGRYRERAVVFTGDAPVEIAPAAPGTLSLGGVQLGARVTSAAYVGPVRCTHTWDWVETFAWRPPAG